MSTGLTSGPVPPTSTTWALLESSHLAAALLGLVLVPVFASFNSIYVAHGAFTASITPAMVVAIVLAMYWRRFSRDGGFLDAPGWFRSRGPLHPLPGPCDALLPRR